MSIEIGRSGTTGSARAEGRLFSGPEELFKAFNDFVARLLRYYLLLAAILGFAIVCIVVLYLFAKPYYTAYATIGPPNPSPVNAMLSNMGMGGLGGGMAKKLLGSAGGGGGNDPFQEYQQLLLSPRLQIALVQKDNFLPQVFDDEWNQKTKQWRPPGALHAVTSAIKAAMHRPVTDHPDVEALGKYFEKNFAVDQAKAVGKSGIANLTGLSSGYLELSFTADDPRKAEHLLTAILARADDVIRREELEDVNARILYVKGELQNIAMAEERQALIETLADQEEMRVMMVADKRFTYVLVSTPYASSVPTFPMSPSKAILAALVLSVLAWGGLVALEPQSAWIRRIIGIFARGRARRAPIPQPQPAPMELKPLRDRA